jgi:hypothetical protein
MHTLDVLERNLKKSGIISKEINLKLAMSTWSQTSDSKPKLSPSPKSSARMISPLNLRSQNFQF